MLKLAQDCTMFNPAQQRVVGAVALLLAQEPNWKGDMHRLLAEEVLPCSRHGKIAFFLNFDRAPVGFITWAHLSQETEQRILSTMDPWLHASEWNEGPSLWIRWLHLPDTFRREGLQLCLDELFPDYPSARLMIRRKASITALELDRTVIERWARRGHGG